MVKAAKNGGGHDLADFCHGARRRRVPTERLVALLHEDWSVIQVPHPQRGQRAIFSDVGQPSARIRFNRLHATAASVSIAGRPPLAVGRGAAGSRSASSRGDCPHRIIEALAERRGGPRLNSLGSSARHPRGGWPRCLDEFY